VTGPDPDDKPVSKAEFWILAILIRAGSASVLTWLLG